VWGWIARGNASVRGRGSERKTGGFQPTALSFEKIQEIIEDEELYVEKRRRVEGCFFGYSFLGRDGEL